MQNLQATVETAGQLTQQPFFRAVAGVFQRDVRILRKVGEVTVFAVEGMNTRNAPLFTPAGLERLRVLLHKHVSSYQFYPYLLWQTRFGEFAASELKTLDWSNLGSHLADWFKHCGSNIVPLNGVVIISGRTVAPPEGVVPLGCAASKQTHPPPIQANIFWWPLEVGPNNDPSWMNGLSLEELYRELQRTMDKLKALGGPGIWNGCKEYNDWQRHREMLLDQLRARQRK